MNGHRAAQKGELSGQRQPPEGDASTSHVLQSQAQKLLNFREKSADAFRKGRLERQESGRGHDRQGEGMEAGMNDVCKDPDSSGKSSL